MEGEDGVVAVTATRPEPLDVLWKAIMELFRQGKPSEAQVREVQGVASLALAVTANPNAFGFPHGAADTQREDMRNVAECSALYGYWLGFHQGQQATNARA